MEYKEEDNKSWPERLYQMFNSRLDKKGVNPTRSFGIATL